MKVKISEFHKVEKLLDEVFRLSYILKTIKNSNPLKSVIQDDLENHLRNLNKITDERLKNKPFDKLIAWHFILKIVDFLYRFMLDITLHCKFFLLRQKFNINIYYKNILMSEF